ncbi:uncharacterized protein J8A68_004393 [[Candida] subhashii]|uniref:Uncharacterized protein n=1 Tax=[Candida] subhashii TaxID=561895 RepID=A0A8J5UKL9_9ASCO|nr:uncharacterized protein J8A68_004393 [[Candida] subhashii]KAG7662131.1 hypothetical protein J8A68_004393 [[Candida] subhashii]
MITLTADELIEYYLNLPNERQSPSLKSYIIKNRIEFEKQLLDSIESSSSPAIIATPSINEEVEPPNAIDLNLIEIDEDTLIQQADEACVSSVNDIATRNFVDEQMIHKQAFLQEIEGKGLTLKRQRANESDGGSSKTQASNKTIPMNY